MRLARTNRKGGSIDLVRNIGYLLLLLFQVDKIPFAVRGPFRQPRTGRGPKVATIEENTDSLVAYCYPWALFLFLPMFSPRTPLLLAALALLGGCTKDDEPVPAPVYLLDQRWQLTELEGQAVAPQTGGTRPDLLLSSVGGTNSGRAFCNQYGGSYMLTPGSPQLRFSDQSSTRATCAGQDAETRYLTLLPGVARYVIRNRRLSLYDTQHAEPLLVFEATE